MSRFFSWKIGRSYFFRNYNWYRTPSPAKLYNLGYLKISHKKAIILKAMGTKSVLHKMFRISTAVFAMLLADAGSAWAVQPHTGQEGYYAHQSAHLLFICSMVYLIVLLGKPALRRLSGWQYIRLASFFFLLWNVDTFICAYYGMAYGAEGKIYQPAPGCSLEDLKSEVYYVTRTDRVFLPCAGISIHGPWGEASQGRD